MQLTVIADSLQVLLKRDAVNGTALVPFADSIVAQSKIVSAIKDESCERQRLAFDHPSPNY